MRSGMATNRYESESAIPMTKQVQRKGGGDCDASLLNYTEIRVHQGDWESSIFYSWVAQIFLSEFLEVPSTVGLKTGETYFSSFYNVDNLITYSSKAYSFEEFITANEVGGDCLDTEAPCAHVMPEVWIGQEKTWKRYLGEGHIDQTNGNGHVGKISWYIPVMTAERHPEVASYHGMAGQRELLSRIFKRPTSWHVYCTEVSSSNCTEPDSIASRAPMPGEENFYFSDGLYTGFFRASSENDCSTNNRTCTGHIVGAPCTWSTNIDAQAYHNDIALSSNGPLEGNGGYSYSHMIQIWRGKSSGQSGSSNISMFANPKVAANATKSDVIMWWFTPDATIEEFRGTDFQFQQVLLPEPTSECRAARIDPEDRCSRDPLVRRGDAVDGGCDNESNSLQKVIASSLRDLTFETPDVDRSPGYRGILNLKVNHLDMNVMLQKWASGGRTGHAARKAVCEYVVEHQKELESFVPRGYPRIFLDDTSYQIPLLFTAVGVAVFAVIYILAVSTLVYYFSDTKVFVYAQVPFIFMVMFGLLLVACGSLFYALEPNNVTCTWQVWLTTLGYTLELVPLLVKVAAINRLMAASKRMRRVRISLTSLFCSVASLVLLVIFFLALWTSLDAPKRVEGRYLIETSAIVTTVACSSESNTWSLVGISWNGVLLVCATVLAFQSRTIKQEFNDSRSLGTMIYSHFVFGVLRAVSFNLGGSYGAEFPSLDPSIAAAASSFLLSIDAITAVSIYILPKLDAARKAPRPHLKGSSRSSSMTGINMNGSKVQSKGSFRESASLGPKRLGFIDQEGDSYDNLSVPRMVRKHKELALSVGSMPSINEVDGDTSSSFSKGDRKKGRIIESNKRELLELEDECFSSDDEVDHGGPRFAGGGSANSRFEDISRGRPPFRFMRRSLKHDLEENPIVAPNVSILTVSGIDPIEEGSESEMNESARQHGRLEGEAQCYPDDDVDLEVPIESA